MVSDHLPRPAIITLLTLVCLLTRPDATLAGYLCNDGLLMLTHYTYLLPDLV